MRIVWPLLSHKPHHAAGRMMRAPAAPHARAGARVRFLVILSGGREAPGVEGPRRPCHPERSPRRGRSRRTPPVAGAFNKGGVPRLGCPRPDRGTPPPPRAVATGEILRLRSPCGLAPLRMTKRAQPLVILSVALEEGGVEGTRRSRAPSTKEALLGWDARAPTQERHRRRGRSRPLVVLSGGREAPGVEGSRRSRTPSTKEALLGWDARVPTKERLRRRGQLRPGRSFDSARPAGSLRSG